MISSVEYSSLGAAAYRSDLWPVALYGPRTAFSGCRSGSRGVYTPQRFWIEDETGKIVGEWTDSFHPSIRTRRPIRGTRSTNWLSPAKRFLNISRFPISSPSPTRSSMRR